MSANNSPMATWKSPIGVRLPWRVGLDNAALDRFFGQLPLRPVRHRSIAVVGALAGGGHDGAHLSGCICRRCAASWQIAEACCHVLIACLAPTPPPDRHRGPRDAESPYGLVHAPLDDQSLRKGVSHCPTPWAWRRMARRGAYPAVLRRAGPAASRMASARETHSRILRETRPRIGVRHASGRSTAIAGTRRYPVLVHRQRHPWGRAAVRCRKARDREPDVSARSRGRAARRCARVVWKGELPRFCRSRIRVVRSRRGRLGVGRRGRGTTR
mgnify:FL=1